MNCALCSLETNRNSPNQKYCPQCARVVNLSNEREYDAVRRLDPYHQAKRKEYKNRPYVKARISELKRIRRRNNMYCALKIKGPTCNFCKAPVSPYHAEFHHVDPSQKEILMSKLFEKKWSRKHDEELAKCVLLHANCHREVHNEGLYADFERRRKKLMAVTQLCSNAVTQLWT